ncbi:MAG: cobalamin-binding protein [Candidatus Melainabacteria bacterium]|nr:cobalamin-binding protein [Candidatus Melainabacteria bacterium]
MANQSLKVFVLSFMFWLSSPGSYSSTSTSQVQTTTVASRIVSLAPSNTELIFAIGAEDKLRGVSRFCNYPPAATRYERVGTFTNASVERLAKLKPEIILLVNGQEALAEMLRKHGFRTVLLNNTSLTQIGENLRIVGRLTGHLPEADKLASALTSSIGNLSGIIAQEKIRPRIFYCVWPQPLLTVGRNTFLNEVITTSGGINIAGQLKAAYPQFSLERLVLSNPDVIILPHEARGQSFLNRQPWISLRAVKMQHVYFLPPPEENYLARPSPHVMEGLYWLSVRLHPRLSGKLSSWLNEWQLAAKAPLSTKNLTK